MPKEPTRKSKRPTLKAVFVPVYRVHYEDLQLGQRTRNANLIVNVLVADGYIPHGKFIIDTHLSHRHQTTQAFDEFS